VLPLICSFSQPSESLWSSILEATNPPALVGATVFGDRLLGRTTWRTQSNCGTSLVIETRICNDIISRFNTNQMPYGNDWFVRHL
jgi:hypothetical protein